MSCERCEQERERAERIAVDLESCETELRSYRRRMKNLQAELAQERKRDPKAKQARELFELWDKLCGLKRGKVFGPKREAAVLARLRDHPAEQIERAIRGVAKYPFSINYKRVSEGPKSARFDDLELICRSETHVEKFAALLDDEGEIAAAAQLTPSRNGSGPDPWSRPLDRAVAALRREFGDDCVEAVFGEGYRADEWWSLCPRHPTPGSRPLRIIEHGAGGSLDFSCAAGCLPSMVLEEIRRLEQRAENHAGPQAAAA